MTVMPFGGSTSSAKANFSRVIDICPVVGLIVGLRRDHEPAGAASGLR
jgi:cobalamin synthase